MENVLCILSMDEEIARIFIPAFVTILVFFLGQFISWSKKKFEKRHETVVIKGLILEWINLITKPINDQIERCVDFSRRIGASQDMQPEIFEINKFLSDKVLTISIDKYIDTFVINTTGIKKENYKMTYNIISQLNFLAINESEIPKVYDKYQTQTFEIMDEWNSSFRKLDQIISNQTKLIVKDTLQNSRHFHSEVLKIANNWYKTSQNGKSTVKHSNDNLIKPLDILISNELTINPSNEYAFDISACLQELRISLWKWNVLNEANKNLFLQLSNTLRLSSENLIKSQKYFENFTKTKCFFLIK